jgi:hypothetical protein
VVERGTEAPLSRQPTDRNFFGTGEAENAIIAHAKLAGRKPAANWAANTKEEQDASRAT